MISIRVLAKQIEKLAVDNAPIILTGVGVAGAITTAVLTGRASFAAAETLRDTENARYQMGKEEPMTSSEKVKVVWREFLPAVGVGATTVACIICANRVSSKRIAAMAAAYSLSEKRFGEYREKVIEKFNANKERQVRDEVAQDRVTKNPPRDSQIIITGNGDVLCFDQPSGRYFRSNMEKLRSVQNDVNAEVNQIGHSTLSYFYQSLNLKLTPYSEELGWTIDKMLDIHFSAVLTDDNQPCIAIDYQVEPIRHATGAGFPRGCDDDPNF